MFEAHIIHNNYPFVFDLSKSYSISLPLNFDPLNNVNCYYSPAPQVQIIRQQGFVGNVGLGGPVNHNLITLAPHGNGTHTETLGHISPDNMPSMDFEWSKTLFLAFCISVRPSTLPNSSDKIILQKEIEKKINELKADRNNLFPEALILRTLPNDASKKTRQYSGTNPPYLEPCCGKWLAQNNILHLVIDLPSPDREQDQGRLEVHKGFWEGARRRYCTISELAYVPDRLADGIYLLGLQPPRIKTDAVPSSLVVYKSKV